MTKVAQIARCSSLMPSVESPHPAPNPGSAEDLHDGLPDFSSAVYKDAYSRINAIVIEGEQEAHDNYMAIGTLLPDQAEALAQLARMELRQIGRAHV